MTQSNPLKWSSCSSCKTLRKNLEKSGVNLQCTQSKQKFSYDIKGRKTIYALRNKAVVLDPNKGQTFNATWEGPFPVVTRLSRLMHKVGINPKDYMRNIFPWLSMTTINL